MKIAQRLLFEKLKKIFNTKMIRKRNNDFNRQPKIYFSALQILYFVYEFQSYIVLSFKLQRSKRT